jgi:hypothetical protein
MVASMPHRRTYLSRQAGVVCSVQAASRVSWIARGCRVRWLPLRWALVHGQITLYLLAFRDEVTLATTLAHEKYHVGQLRRGVPYRETDAEAISFEREAWEFEKIWWDVHPLNPKNMSQ